MAHSDEAPRYSAAQSTFRRRPSLRRGMGIRPLPDDFDSGCESCSALFISGTLDGPNVDRRC
jgi:hypothetical protein